MIINIYVDILNILLSINIHILLKINILNILLNVKCTKYECKYTEYIIKCKCTTCKYN